MSVNEPLLRECVDMIEANPEQWDQRDWEADTSCGTTRCLAGWAIHLSYPELNSIYDFSDIHRTTIREKAQELLGLTTEQAYDLFLGYEGFGAEDVEGFKRYVTQVTGVEFKEKVSK